MTEEVRDETIEAAPEPPDEPAPKPTTPPKPKQRCRFRWFLFGWALLAVALLAVGHLWPRLYSGQAIFEHRSSSAGKQMSGVLDTDFETHKRALVPELVGPQALEKVVGELRLTRGLSRDDCPGCDHAEQCRYRGDQATHHSAGNRDDRGEAC